MLESGPRKDGSTSLTTALGEPDYGLLGGIRHLRVGAGSTVEGVIAVHPVLGVDHVVARTAEELVVARIAPEDVIASEALYRVVATASADDVGARGAGDRVGLGIARYGALASANDRVGVGDRGDVTRVIRGGDRK